MTLLSEGRLFAGACVELPLQGNPVLKGQILRVFLYIAQQVQTTGSFPKTTDIVEVLLGDVTSWRRGRMVNYLRALEGKGLIARKPREDLGSPAWNTHGYLTEAGRALAAKLPAFAQTRRLERKVRTGGGLHEDGGTRFKDMLTPAEEFGRRLIAPADTFSKLGVRVTKGAAGSRHRGLRLTTFSLEEGRTCSPTCGMRDECYAGKMSGQKRVLYEGLKTDQAFTDAIAKGRRQHVRLNTVGDFPNQGFVDALLLGLMQSGKSTAFGYTHWQPEQPLGAYIRKMSHLYWEFFAVRTSYEHGSRKPIPERAAVVVDEFDEKVLALHRAVPCPEQTGKAKNCGSCGFCWNTKQNVAFKRH